nr:immunoglobulin heavy chain junction region [Macaca mulatta]
CARSSNGFDFW